MYHSFGERPVPPDLLSLRFMDPLFAAARPVVTDSWIVEAAKVVVLATTALVVDTTALVVAATAVVVAAAVAVVDVIYAATYSDLPASLGVSWLQIAPTAAVVTA